MKKSFFKFLFIVTFVFLGENVFAQKVGVLNGPSGIPCAYLMEKSTDYTFETFASAQTELPKLINGEIDIGFLPPNAAAKVFTKNKKALLCLGVTGMGNIYLISKDSSINTVSDLEGKTVSCAGQGATPEYMLRFLLEQNNVKNVELDFSIPNAEIAPSLISGKIKYALVPEPFASVAQMKSSDVKINLDIQKEFYKVKKTDFPMTLLVVNAKYAKKHKKEIAKFINDISEAIKWTVANPVEAGVLVEKNGLGLKADVASAAIPNANYVWMDAKKSRVQIEKLLQLFLDFDKSSVGGKLPDKSFYYN